MVRNAQKGFSLIELMVVVAIIGILATIAIPRVNRFIAKSRTSEAQVNLSSLYTFNKNFFVEFQGYTNAFAALGYAPEGKLRYNAGWATAARWPVAYTAMGKSTANTTTNTATWCGILGAGGGAAECDVIPGPGKTGAQTIANDTASDTGFTAVAVALLVAGAADDVDTWTIDANKNLNNTNDGTDGIP